MLQVAWIITYLDDIASDFAVLHNIYDITVLPGPWFFKMAWRLPAYRGVMRERYLLEAHERDERGGAPARPHTRPHERREVPATKAALQNDEALRGIFSFG